MKRCIVDYSSSSSDGEAAVVERKPVPKKRKLPSLSTNLIVPAPKDDPALHQGRVRTISHVDGNWASHVYLSIAIRQSQPIFNLIQEAITTAQTTVPNLLSFFPDNSQRFKLHISLSRPIFIRAYQKEELRSVVMKMAKRSPFMISFTKFAELQNDEHTRTFLIMEIGAGHQELKELCSLLEPFLYSLRQRSYYSSPRFHASVAWALMDNAQSIALDSLEDLTTQTNRPDSSPNGQATSTTTIKPSTNNILTIPEDVIAELNQKYAAQLSSIKTGAFEVGSVTIKIGKEIISWPFTGV